MTGGEVIDLVSSPSPPQSKVVRRGKSHTRRGGSDRGNDSERERDCLPVRLSVDASTSGSVAVSANISTVDRKTVDKRATQRVRESEPLVISLLDSQESHFDFDAHTDTHTVTHRDTLDNNTQSCTHIYTHTLTHISAQTHNAHTHTFGDEDPVEPFSSPHWCDEEEIGSPALYAAEDESESVRDTHTLTQTQDVLVSSRVSASLTDCLSVSLSQSLSRGDNDKDRERKRDSRTEKDRERDSHTDRECERRRKRGRESDSDSDRDRGRDRLPHNTSSHLSHDRRPPTHPHIHHTHHTHHTTGEEEDEDDDIYETLTLSQRSLPRSVSSPVSVNISASTKNSSSFSSHSVPSFSFSSSSSSSLLQHASAIDTRTSTHTSNPTTSSHNTHSVSNAQTKSASSSDQLRKEPLEKEPWMREQPLSLAERLKARQREIARQKESERENERATMSVSAVRVSETVNVRDTESEVEIVSFSSSHTTHHTGSSQTAHRTHITHNTHSTSDIPLSQPQISLTQSSATSHTQSSQRTLKQRTLFGDIIAPEESNTAKKDISVGDSSKKPKRKNARRTVDDTDTHTHKTSSTGTAVVHNSVSESTVCETHTSSVSAVHLPTHPVSYNDLHTASYQQTTDTQRASHTSHGQHMSHSQSLFSSVTGAHGSHTSTHSHNTLTTAAALHHSRTTQHTNTVTHTEEHSRLSTYSDSHTAQGTAAFPSLIVLDGTREYEVMLLVDKRERANALLVGSLVAARVRCELAQLAVGDFLWVAVPKDATPNHPNNNNNNNNSSSSSNSNSNNNGNKSSGKDNNGSAKAPKESASVRNGGQSKKKNTTAALDEDSLIGGLEEQILVLDCIAERKSVADLASSLLDGRYTEQKYRLRATGIRSCLYVVEGEQLSLPTQIKNYITPQHIKTAMTVTHVEHDMHVIRTRGMEHSTQVLQHIHRQVLKRFEAVSEAARKSSSSRNTEVLFQRFSDFQTLYTKRSSVRTFRELWGAQLRQIRGVSSAVAHALTEKFGTFAEWMRYLRERDPRDVQKAIAEMRKVGHTTGRIGPKLAKTIMDVYNSEY